MDENAFDSSHNHRMMRGQTSTNTRSSKKMYSIALDLPVGATEIEIDLPGGLKRTFKKEAINGNKDSHVEENVHVLFSSVSPDEDFWAGEDTSDGSTFDFILDEDGNIHGSLVDLKDATISQFRVDAEGSPFVVTTPSSEFPDEEDYDDEPIEDNIMTPSGFDSDQNDNIPHNRDLTMVSLNSTQAIDGYDKKNDSLFQISSQPQYQQERSLAFDDSGKNLDVLVVWSKKAECRESNLPTNCSPTSRTETNMRAMVRLAVAETNEAYRLSGVDTQLLLVHAYRHPTYDDPGNFGTTLSHLAGTSDGNMDDVHTLRARYGADIVAMIAYARRSCGIGYIGPRKNWMFSVTKYSCATGHYTFGHEIGHNLGLNHDRGTKEACSSSNYNYGYRDPNAAFRSIMAYNCKSGQCDNK